MDSTGGRPCEWLAAAELDVEAAESDAAEINPELEENREKYRKFWGEFLGKLHVEANQTLPQAGNAQNQFFRMPKGSDGWISAYLGQSSENVGVYLTFWRGAIGDKIYAELEKERVEITATLGFDAQWYTKENGQHCILIKRRFPGEYRTDSRQDVQKWLVEHTERFLAVFRPRIERILRELG